MKENKLQEETKTKGNGLLKNVVLPVALSAAILIGVASCGEPPIYGYPEDCECEKTEVVDCDNPNCGKEEIPGECQDCKERENEHICKDLWACVTATSNSLKTVIDTSRETCADNNCLSPVTCEFATHAAYTGAALDLWGGRPNAGAHDITSGFHIIPHRIEMNYPHGTRKITPCLTPAERAAGETAGMAQVNENTCLVL